LDGKKLRLAEAIGLDILLQEALIQLQELAVTEEILVLSK